MPARCTDRNTTHPFQGQLKLPLASVIQVFASDLSLAQWTTAYADWIAKHAPKPSTTARTGGAGSAFATDSQISGASDKERELVRWDGAEGGEIDFTTGGGQSTGEFNQFETFERMTGKTSTFKFDEYSTPLDRSSAFYKSNEARAAAIASSILSSEAGSAHQRLEREGDEDVTHRDRDMDEGDLFSDVRRDGAPPSATGKYKPGAFAQAKKAAGGAPNSAAKDTANSKSPTPITSPSKDGGKNGATKATTNGAAATDDATATSPKPNEEAQKKEPESAAPKEATAGDAAAASGTSSESKDGASDPPKKKSTLNPKAAAFKMNASAPAFVPGGASSAPPPAAVLPPSFIPAPFISAQQQAPQPMMFIPPGGPGGIMPAAFPMQPQGPAAPLLQQQQQQLLMQQFAAVQQQGRFPQQPFFNPQQAPLGNQAQLLAAMAAQQFMAPQFAGMPGGGVQPQFNPAAAAAFAQLQRQQQQPPNQQQLAMQQAFIQQQLQQQQQPFRGGQQQQFH